MQNERQQVNRFAVGISSLLERERCYINQGVKGQELLKKASSVFMSHLVVAQQSPSALFRLHERYCVPHQSKGHTVYTRLIAAFTDTRCVRKVPRLGLLYAI